MVIGIFHCDRRFSPLAGEAMLDKCKIFFIFDWLVSEIQGSESGRLLSTFCWGHCLMRCHKLKSLRHEECFMHETGLLF